MASSSRTYLLSTAANGYPSYEPVVNRSRWSDASPATESDSRRLLQQLSQLSLRSTGHGRQDAKKAVQRPGAAVEADSPVISIDRLRDEVASVDGRRQGEREGGPSLDEQDDSLLGALAIVPRYKASRILGIQHRQSMEPIPASTRTSIAASTRSAPPGPGPSPDIAPSAPLTSLYVVSGLPKSPNTWTLSDPDSVLGLHHSEGAVNRWWRPEVLGSTVSPGAGAKPGGRKRSTELLKGGGALSKQDVAKMLSKALKLSFTREVEIIASTLQPASTIHSFTFTLTGPTTPLAGSTTGGGLLRSSVLSTGSHADPRASATTFSHYHDDPPKPSSDLLGPPPFTHGPAPSRSADGAPAVDGAPGTVTYHGVCLTVWSHADAERSAAIRRTFEGRSRKESAHSLRANRLKALGVNVGGDQLQTRRRGNRARPGARVRGPWGAAETDTETEGEGAGVSESEYEVASTVGHAPGESTVFLPGDAVFWLPYALTLVSRHPIYDLMRDYLTLSWARFSKDVQSHTLQISKILSRPAPRAGELIKLDASTSNDEPETSLEVVARFPGGLDFGRGLVDINFTMWPLFKCLNIDNILTICEIALSPTGRILFYSRHPAMLGIAISTIKYLVELRGWTGIALPAVHCRDAKIYIEDPGPWMIGLATEARYSVRAPTEVCIVDLDINYLNCASPPPGCISVKQQREKYRQRLMAAFEPLYHPDHCVPNEFKEAFPAGRFRPVCKIQAKRGASPTAVADAIKPPEWWHSTRIIQAFDSVLQDKMKPPSFLKRISSFGSPRRPPQLTVAEQHVQLSIRKRATAFVDARDELETKIGRLTRRLNFLMTESDLWRDKFVTFEQYAEKLSGEANELRAKINKEQRESRRLSSIVTSAAAERTKLTAQLKETETAYSDAVTELGKMKGSMEKMELERAAMIEEVEAQIERALASMAVGMDDLSDYSDDDDSGTTTHMRRNASAPGSRTGSRVQSASGHSQSRTRHMRSFATESTLTESSSKDELTPGKMTAVIAEEDEEERPKSPIKRQRKRFSAGTVTEPGQDGMAAVDEGINEKSDRIAQKMLQIQQKLDAAMVADQRVTRWKSNSSHDSESDTAHSLRPHGRSTKGSRAPSRKTHRKRASHHDSISSSATTKRPASAPHADISEESSSPPDVPRTSMKTTHSGDAPEKAVSTDTARQSAPINSPNATVAAVSSGTPALTHLGTADDSETDFQSARSISSPGSYLKDEEVVSSDEELEERDDLEMEIRVPRSEVRQRPRNDSAVTARLPV